MSSDAGAFRPDPLSVAIPRGILSAVVILLKVAVSPLLYLARRVGYEGALPGRVTEAIYRACLPLTEKPDVERRVDVPPSLMLGHRLPDMAVTQADGSTLWIGRRRRTPLLLVLIRGSWCPYSRLHVADLEMSRRDFANARLEVLVVSHRQDALWWRSRGIGLCVAADRDGELFDELGIRADSWLDRVWGRIVPHESVFLFDEQGGLVAADVRRVSGLRPGQRFLAAECWVKAARSLTVSPDAPGSDRSRIVEAISPQNPTMRPQK